MADNEHLELLASRYFDGDLSPADNAELEAALAASPELRALHADLERVHNSVTLLATHRLPVDFTSRILDGIDQAERPVLQLPTRSWNHWAAAAAVLLTFGLLVGAAVYNTGGRPVDAPQVAFNKPATRGDVGTGAVVERGPSANLVAFSDGEVEVVSLSGREFTKRFEGSVSLPAEVSAPSNTHAVIELRGGTAVLSPGARARLTDSDADGMPDVEPLDGDLYMESSGTSMRGRVGTMSVNVDGGMTLRRTGSGYVLEPSHGGAQVDGRHFSFRERAVFGPDGLEVSPREVQMLDEWAVRGRADAIRVQVKRLLREKFERIPAEHWSRWETMLHGVLSRPHERATYAHTLRFLLKYDFLEGSSADEREAWGTIAAILAEGTTLADIPVQIMEWFRLAEEEFQRNPDALPEFKQMLRDMLEQSAKRQD